MELVFATGNEGKLSEVKHLFEDYDVKVLSLKDFDNLPEIIEDADDFVGNSLIKVRTIYDAVQLPVIGDDSGLAVDQLGGEPGVYSARYAGENCTYDDNNKKLIKELKKFPEPHTAKFICALSYKDDANEFTVIGELEGKIISEFKGTNGFGYDPVFVPKGFDITLAEMTKEEKNKISHRAKAFFQLREELLRKGII